MSTFAGYNFARLDRLSRSHSILSSPAWFQKNFLQPFNEQINVRFGYADGGGRGEVIARVVVVVRAEPVEHVIGYSLGHSTPYNTVRQSMNQSSDAS